MNDTYTDEFFFLLDHEQRTTTRVNVINENKLYIKGRTSELAVGKILIHYKRDFKITKKYLLILEITSSKNAENHEIQVLNTREISNHELINMMSKSWGNDVRFDIDDNSDVVQLWINDTFCHGYSIALDDGFLAVKIKNRVAATELENLPIYKVLQIFSQIEYCFENPLFQSSKVIIYNDHSTDTKPFISLELSNSGFTWNKPYSIQQYFESIINLHPIDRRNEFTSYLTELDGFGLDNPLGFIKYDFDDNASLKETIDEMIIFIEQLHETATTNLRYKSTIFNFEFYFPDEIRTPCEQYLIYFSQFMMDLGIKIKNDITHENERTIFTVSQENQCNALSTIQDALNAFVTIPIYDKSTLTSINSDIAATQLEFNIDCLKRQLLLAKSTISAYEKTVESQSIILKNASLVNQNDEYIDTTKIMDDIEPIFGNYLLVKKFEKNGLIVNYPLIIRALKRRFSFKG